MKKLKNIAKNVFSNWIGFFFSIVIAFFLSPFIVHKLGNIYYGLWVVMMQMSGYLGILELGVRSSVVKYVSEYIAKKDYRAFNELISLAITIYSIAAIISIMVSIIISLLFSKIFNFPDESLSTANIIVLIIGFNVSIGFIFNVFYGILMGIQRYDICSMVGIIATLLKTITIISFLYSGYGIIALGCIQFGFSLLTNFAIVLICKRLLPQLQVKIFFFEVKLFKKVFSYSSISFFINISQKIVFQTDLVVIGAFLNAIHVTYYSIPVTLVEYMRRFIISMTEVFVPITSEFESKGDRNTIVQLLINGTKMSLIIALPICIVFYFNGREFIQLWMGEEYADNGENVLKVLSVTHLLSMTHLTGREILFGMALHRFNAIFYGCEAVANLLLSILLVKSYGIIGVAIGTAIPHIIFIVIGYPILMSRVLDFNISIYLRKAMVPPAISSIPFIAFCKYLSCFHIIDSLPEYFVSISSGLPIYFFCVYFISFNYDERENIKKAIRSKLSIFKNS